MIDLWDKINENKNRFALIPENYTSIIQQLAGRIGEIMQTSPNDLFQFFYRIDLPEEKVKQAMRLNTDQEKYTSLATLVLQRELQRRATYEQYKNNDSRNRE